MLFVHSQNTLQPMNLLPIVLWRHLQMSRSWITFIIQALWPAITNTLAIGCFIHIGRTKNIFTILFQMSGRALV